MSHQLFLQQAHSRSPKLLVLLGSLQFHVILLPDTSLSVKGVYPYKVILPDSNSMFSMMLRSKLKLVMLSAIGLSPCRVQHSTTASLLSQKMRLSYLKHFHASLQYRQQIILQCYHSQFLNLYFNLVNIEIVYEISLIMRYLLEFALSCLQLFFFYKSKSTLYIHDKKLNMWQRN